jgi:hypothetical protein
MADELGASSSDDEDLVTKKVQAVQRAAAPSGDAASVSSDSSASSGGKAGAGGGKVLKKKKKKNKSKEGKEDKAGKGKKLKKSKKLKKAGKEAGKKAGKGGEGKGKKGKEEESGSDAASEAEDDDDDDDDDDEDVSSSSDEEEEAKKGERKAGASKSASKDDFIASDDDNESLANEYNKEEQDIVSDEDPYEDDKKRGDEKEEGGKARKAKDEDEDDKGNHFKQVLKKMAASRNRGKKEQLSENEMQLKVDDVLKRMNEMVKLDNRARSALKPATHKLGMLEEVVTALLRKDMQPVMLERGALRWLGEWLRPNKVDNQLPAQSIRTRIIGILPQLQIEIQHLERSKFGRVVNFLSQSDKETPGNRAILTELMRLWAREVFVKQAAHNIGPQILRTDEADEEDDSKPPQKGGEPKPPQPRAQAAAPARADKPASKPLLADLAEAEQSAEADPSKKEKGGGAYRARIPQARNFNFKVAPTSNKRTAEDAKIDSMKPSAKRLELEKKLLQTRKKRQTG